MSVAQDVQKEKDEARKKLDLDLDEARKKWQEARKQTEEYKRLQKTKDPNNPIPWKKWGPYLSDRQWNTVREDYSEKGETWKYFSYDDARHRSYRWGEDGIFGISDDHQRLCFALTLWNGKDEYWIPPEREGEKGKKEKCLKERFFGLPGFGGKNQGNHMEDLKEYYFYIDNTPTHSYMKALYKYPYEFPYKELIEENDKRKQNNEYGGKDKPEYELIDTGCFDDGYFDVVVEYAKNTPEDILIKISIWNRISKDEENKSQEEENNNSHRKTLHVLPTLWFRNTWSWSAKEKKQKPFLEKVSDKFNNKGAIIKAHHVDLGDRYLYCKEATSLLFTENENNNKYIFGNDNASSYLKDGINNYVAKDQKDKVNPKQKGTKASAYYTFDIDSKECKVLYLRLTDIAPDKFSNSDPFGTDFEECFKQRNNETDKFYQAITPFPISEEERAIQRQAFAGMLWTKQFYYYVVQDWLQDQPNQKNKKNRQWTHLHNEEIISMPDTWEYPYYCVWDSAFHAVTLALIDPDFAKEQLCLFTKPWYMHPSGQIPSCEFDFDEVNPPILAWGALKVYELENEIYAPENKDKQFLQTIFDALLMNFTWWLSSKKLGKKYLFSAGFLGLDNISIIDRNQFQTDTVTIEQVDATSWVAMFSLNMLKIATYLGEEGHKVYQEMANKFLIEFILIAHEINEIADKDQMELWDIEDNFYYEILKISLPEFSLELPIKYRSIAFPTVMRYSNRKRHP